MKNGRSPKANVLVNVFVDSLGKTKGRDRLVSIPESPV